MTVGDRVIDLAETLDPSTAGLSPMRRHLLAHGGGLPTSVDQFAGLVSVDLSSLNVLPLVPDPSKIVAAPVNYVAHSTR